MSRKYHFEYVRDGGPVACNCEINHDHDVDAITRIAAQQMTDDVITKFRDSLGFVAPELYKEKFAQLSQRIQGIVSQVG